MASSSSRRSSRVQVRMPVVISGKLPDGRSFREKTHVLTVSKFGARLKSEHALTTGMEIDLKPLESKRPSRFKVVWVASAESQRAGEIGVEYIEVSNLLGVSFPG